MKKKDNEGYVDVVIPAYNAEKYIRECLNSALNQTYKNINIIVVNDGSSDSTEEILNEYKDRITIINQKNSGPSRARNVGIQTGEGEFIAFLDSDDLWDSVFLEKTLDLLQRHRYMGFVFTENNVFTKDGIITNHWIKDDGRVAQIPIREKFKDEIIFARHIWSDLALGSFIPTSGILIRRCTLEKVGLFDETLTNAEDRDLFIRLARKYDGGFIETCLSFKREHPLGLCQNYEKVVLGSDIVSRRLLESSETDAVLQKNIKMHLQKQWYSLGRLYLDQNNMKNAKKAFIKSIQAHPNFSSFFFLGLSILRIFTPLKTIKRYFSKP